MAYKKCIKLRITVLNGPGKIESLIREFDNEIQVLLHTPLEDVERNAGSTVSDAIGAFREGKIEVIPGGGGQYGTVLLPGQEADVKNPFAEDIKGQKTLFDY